MFDYVRYISAGPFEVPTGSIYMSSSRKDQSKNNFQAEMLVFRDILHPAIMESTYY